MLTVNEIKKLIKIIKSDLYRYAGCCNFNAFLKEYIRSPGFNYMFWLRIRVSVNSKLLGFILFRKRLKFGISIYPMKIGEGFYIGHYGGIFIGSDVKIGKYCNISQGVTIGRINRGPKKGFPTIGDYVYVAPGAKILGNITVGNNVAVGANCVVTSDVPDNSVVVGIPAKIISNKGSEGYIHNVPEVPFVN